MTDEYKDFEITVFIKRCDQDFGLGPGVLGRQVHTPETTDQHRLAWYLTDTGSEMIKELVDYRIKEVTGEPEPEDEGPGVYSVELCDHQLYLFKDGVGLREATEAECDLSRQINELQEQLARKEDSWKCQRCGYFNAESVRPEDLAKD